MSILFESSDGITKVLNSPPHAVYYEIWQANVPDCVVGMWFDQHDTRKFEKLARALRREFYRDETPLSDDPSDTLANCLRGEWSMIAEETATGKIFVLWFDDDDHVLGRGVVVPEDTPDQINARLAPIFAAWNVMTYVQNL